MDVSQYLEIFLDETKEHLQNLNTLILNLEQNPEDMDTINEIFRAAHSLKGMAGTMGYKRMQNLTHDMENVFSEVRNGQVKVKANTIDILFQCLDALENYLANIQSSSDEGTENNEPLIKLLNGLLDPNNTEEVSKKATAKAPVKEAVKETVKAVETQSTSEKKTINTAEPKKWLDIKLDESAKEAIRRGKKVYGITVFVQESCILKAARAFLVFKALEPIGEIIVSAPSTQDIEDEKFDLDFSMFFITDKESDVVMRAIKNVSEIREAIAEEIDKSQLIPSSDDDGMEEADTSTEETQKKAETNTAVAATTQNQVADTSNAKQDKKNTVSKPIVNRTVRVDIEKLDVLMNLVSELIIAKNSLVSAAGSDTTSSTNVNEQIEYLESVTTNLHESVMKVRMVPIESVLNKFPRMIRDLSKSLNKRMELYMTGEDTELDRTVVDEIGDPLMHLLRNSADHGLESPEVRKQRGKNAVGSIFLDAYQDGNNVIIEVRDDGNGIDVEVVKNKAIERGVITPEQAENMPDKDIINLLFLPSFSTAKVVSDVSGRGVGLDVVKSKIE